MPLKIEIFSSPGCSKCTQAKKQLLKLIAEYNPDDINIEEINVLENLDYAVDLGIVTTPAIAINGKLCFTSLPSIKSLKDKIQLLMVED